MSARQAGDLESLAWHIRVHDDVTWSKGIKMGAGLQCIMIQWSLGIYKVLESAHNVWCNLWNCRIVAIPNIWEHCFVDIQGFMCLFQKKKRKDQMMDEHLTWAMYLSIFCATRVLQSWYISYFMQAVYWFINETKCPTGSVRWSLWVLNWKKAHSVEDMVNLLAPDTFTKWLGSYSYHVLDYPSRYLPCARLALSVSMRHWTLQNCRLFTESSLSNKFHQQEVL